MSRKGALLIIIASVLFTLQGCFTVKTANKPLTGDPSGRTPSAVREFRAAWVATVANINWPSKPGIPVEQQKKEAIELLDLLHDHNFNAVVFQVRPHCDALYDSKLEPWSYYLTGTQGQAPDPYYDPLQFWIEEAHKRGLELHAWLNPYRAHHVSGGPLTESSIVKQKPGLALYLERGYWWLDPSLQATQDHSYNVVMDLVERYDLDGIHFDDYFYPYPDYNNFNDFPDNESWDKYKADGGKMSRGDWRRDAVNTFIERVYKGIKQEKPWVKFGLSPFGIWRPYNPPSISGFDQYDVLYADAKKWLNEGWIDYYAPQLYWTIDKEAQSYPVLLGWWASQNTKDRHLWPGINIGRLKGDEAIDETIDQVMITRGMVPESPGVIHWSIAPLVYNPLLADAMAEGPYKKQALVPPSPWLSTEKPPAPQLSATKQNDSVSISWNNSSNSNSNSSSNSVSSSPGIARYVVYYKYGSSWEYSILNKNTRKMLIPAFRINREELLSMDPGTSTTRQLSNIFTPLDSIGLGAVDRYGNESTVQRQPVNIYLADAPDPIALRKAYTASMHPPLHTKPPAKEAFRVKAHTPAADLLSTGNEQGTEKAMDEALETAKAKGANTLLLNVSTFTPPAPHLVQQAVSKAHAAGLRVAPLFDPTAQKSLAGTVNHYAAEYDIDGLAFKTNRNPAASGSTADPSQYDIIEDAVTQAMMVKPYLFAVTLDNEGMTVPLREDYIMPQQAVRLNLSALLDNNPSGREVYLPDEGRVKITGNDGSIAYIATTTDTIRLVVEGDSIILPTDYWVLPYNYTVQPGNTVSRTEPWVEFRRAPQYITGEDEFDLLCRAPYPSVVSINGHQVKQYKTGVFFKTVKLAEGANRIRATAVTGNSDTVFYEREIIYRDHREEISPYPLWVDGPGISPAHEVELLQSDVLPFSFPGSSGQEAEVLVIPGNMILDCTAEDRNDYSLYSTQIPLKNLAPGKYSILIRLKASDPEYKGKPYEVLSPYNFYVKGRSDFPLVRVTKENSRLTYNLGAPRLGGPLRAELPAGTVLQVSGRLGDKYRVSLSNTESGFVSMDNVAALPAGAVKPSYYITNMSCAPSGGADMLSIPYPEPVPFEVRADPGSSRIIITLFGVRTSSTWISHFAGLKVIDNITWEQSDPLTYRAFVNLQTDRIWGYDYSIRGNRLVFRFKYPPRAKLTGSNPLDGIKIAIEAGHGGRNTGAIGLSGLLEKDINLDLSQRLAELLRSKGAEVVQVRDSDTAMSLLQKREKAIESGADMLISIHANAAGGGYLRVDGTSTYYHNPFWSPLAHNIYDRLLELGLDQFGVVGSFNYTVTRMTQMPAVLVEQAFMTHAEDEEKMANPEFRQQMAEKIYKGIEDYLKN